MQHTYRLKAKEVNNTKGSTTPIEVPIEGTTIKSLKHGKICHDRVCVRVCLDVPAGFLAWCLGGQCSCGASTWWRQPSYTPWHWHPARCTLWKRWWHQTNLHPEEAVPKIHLQIEKLESGKRRRGGKREREATLTSSMTRNSWLGVSSTSINWMMLGCRTLRSTATSFSIRCSCWHTDTVPVLMLTATPSHHVAQGKYVLITFRCRKHNSSSL